MDDDFFDDDEALDYAIIEETEERNSNHKSPKGCLSSVVLLVLSASILGLILI